MSFISTPVHSKSLLLKSLIFMFCGAMLTGTNMLSAQSLPHPDHIVILIEENQANSEVIGNPTYAPYINQLANDSDGNIFNNMFAIEHPSQPNYLDMFSGSNQGVTDDNLPTNYPFTTANLAQELLAKGLTFVTYSQDLPSVGSDIVSSGSYVRKHNPVTNWVGTGQNQVPDTLNQPYTALPTDFTKLPTVAYVVPNEDSDMHNGFGDPTIAAGDFWFSEHLTPLMNWISDPNSNTLFIYTFDEDDGLAANNIPTVFYGPMVRAGHDATTYNLYNVLRTIEDIYGLGYAGASSSTVPILDCWKYPTAISSVNAVTAVKCHPNPASSLLQFEGDALKSANTEIELTDITGRHLETIPATGANMLSVNVSGYATGLYLYNIISNGHSVQTGKFNVTR